MCIRDSEALTTARGQIARTLGCQAKDLYFTSCGSESNNLAVQGLAMARKNWGSKIVVSGFEHPSVQRPIRALKDRGFEVVEILPEADGHLDVAKLAAEVDKNTVLVSCMAVNNETGTLQDIAALSTAVKAKNSRCAVHVDAVQAWLRMPIDLIPDQIYKILPYVVTVIVLVFTSMRNNRDKQPPASLGLAYFREER